jgi:hypothetical protein
MKNIAWVVFRLDLLKPPVVGTIGGREKVDKSNFLSRRVVA